MNSVVLSYMRESWLLSQKQVEDLISSNPYYVQDKLLDDITEQFFVNPNLRQWSWKIKALKSWTDELDFEVDKVFDNMYDNNLLFSGSCWLPVCTSPFISTLRLHRLHPLTAPYYLTFNFA
jgi:hypothetical protein